MGWLVIMPDSLRESDIMAPPLIELHRVLRKKGSQYSHREFARLPVVDNSAFRKAKRETKKADQGRLDL